MNPKQSRKPTNCRHKMNDKIMIIISESKVPYLDVKTDGVSAWRFTPTCVLAVDVTIVALPAVVSTVEVGFDITVGVVVDNTVEGTPYKKKYENLTAHQCIPLEYFPC